MEDASDDSLMHQERRWTQATEHIGGRRSPSSSTQKTELSPGDKVGRYVLLDVLGEGGMGVVYRALDPELSRKVALKVLHPSIARDDTFGAARDRLSREARAMAQVSHPNVISVFDVGTEGDQVFVAMELIVGGNLRQWLSGGPTWRQAVALFLEAGQGLAVAHEAGLVHRDFKPANVLVGAGPRAIVTDFGLARSVKTEDVASTWAQGTTEPEKLTTITQTGSIVGTPRYMAPEQFHSSEPDAAGDQFSFCVALYEVLYGCHPFERTEAEESHFERLLSERPASVPVGKETPPALEAAIMRGLSLRPVDRFANMRDLLAAIEDALREAPKERSRSRRGPLLAGGAVLLGVAALAVLRPAAEQGKTTPPLQSATVKAVPSLAPPPSTPKKAVAESPAKAPAPLDKEVRFLAVPSAARWTIDGQVLDCNPCTVTRPEGQEVTGVATLRGYTSKRLVVRAGDQAPDKVRLVAKPRTQKTQTKSPQKDLSIFTRYPEKH